MKTIRTPYIAACVMLLGACGQGNDNGADATPAAVEDEEAISAGSTESAVTEIVPGLSIRILREGDGETAQAGQTATVHYTGWLYDPDAPGSRGAKFDSSVDRGQYFEFPLGAGAVIEGWDQGVVGMKVGESRELIIAPELAYGDREIGDLIPPGSTLLFEVELAGVSGGAPAAE